MPRSSRHKSHKQSKHSSKDAKDLLSDSEEDVKMKERNTTTREGASGRVTIESSHLSSGEKRRLSSSFQSKEGKDMSYPGNGDASEEYVSSKMRKDKVEGISGGADRWTAGGDVKDDAGAMEKEIGGQISKLDLEKGLKSRDSKVSSDIKSKSSRRHESGAEEDRDMASVLKEKEVENKSSSTRGDSKRKSTKDSGRGEGRDSKDTKEKERVSERDSKKVQESKQESEARVNVGGVTKKRDYLWEDADKERPVKRGKENSELGMLDELRNPESEKEPEKSIHRKTEGSGDRDRYHDARENDYKNASSKGDPAKDGKYKDERYRVGNHRENYQDNMEKDDGHRDDKYREHSGGDRDNRRRNDKYRDGAERESRKEDSHRNDGDRDSKYREDDKRDVQLRDDKYHEDKERESKHRDDKYLEGGKDSRRDNRYYENGDRGAGLKDEKYRGKNDRHKEERRREDYEKDSELRDGRHGDNFDREKRVREAKRKDDRSFRDRSGDKSVAKNLREETHSSELLSRKSGFHDDSPSYDDRSRLKGAQGRKRTSDKDDYNDMRARGFKDQRYDLEKRSASDVRVDLVSDRGRSGSRYADVEATSIRSRHSPSSSSHVTRDQYRLLKQDELKYREYAYEERVGHNITSTREYGSAAGVTEKISLTRSSEVIPKDDGLMGELSAERRMKSDTRNSPRQLVTPSSSSADRRHCGKSDFHRSDDVEESGQRSGGFKEAKNYSAKEGRGTREMASETCPGDEPSLVDGDAISVSSPYPRNSHVSSSSKPFSHPFPPPFRAGIDSPQGFRSAEDDGRMKSSNRHRRNGDPNMVRVQGSPWKGLPNWPSPVANGFMPFQHGPPVGFHPAMQPFPAPPIIGMRPSMELNHPGVPYPVPDGDRLSLHGRHVGWRTPVYDPRPPQLRSWEINDAAIGGESHFFGRQDWHHGRPLQGGRPWETGGDSWKSSKPVASFEQPPAFEKDDNESIHYPEDPTPPSQSSEQVKNEQTYCAGEYVDATHTSDIVNEKTPVASEDVPEETPDAPQMSRKNDALLCHVYLSMLDISADLTDPELFSKYKDLVNVDEKTSSDPKDDKPLYVEAPKAKARGTSELSSGSLFPTINDSLLQKSMSLYRKHRVGFMISGKIAPTPAVDNEGALHSYPEKPSLRGEEVKSDVEDIHPEIMDVEQSNVLENLQDEPVITNNVEISEDKLRDRNAQEDLNIDSKGQMCTLETYVPMETEESQSGGSPGMTEVAIPPRDALSNQLGGEQILPVTKNGSLNLSNVSSKAHEVDVPELTSEPVNLSRIHHSAESTH